MSQDVRNAPSIINVHTLEVVQDFTYLGSTITSNLSTDVDINKRFGKASSAMSRLTNRVWENGALTRNTSIQVYKACVLSILLYGSETWTSIASTHFTYFTSGASLTSNGRITPPTQQCSSWQTLPACMLPLASIACDGSATCVVWRMDESQNTSSTVSFK